jgi:hypothetical protein
VTQLPIRYLKLGLVYIAGDDWGGGSVCGEGNPRIVERKPSRVGQRSARMANCTFLFHASPLISGQLSSVNMATKAGVHCSQFHCRRRKAEDMDAHQRRANIGCLAWPPRPGEIPRL